MKIGCFKEVNNQVHKNLIAALVDADALKQDTYLINQSGEVNFILASGLIVPQKGDSTSALKEKRIIGTSISIAMTSYNHAELITEALDSILMQNHTKWELVIVDDCSTDNTLEVLEDYITKYDIKEKVKIIRHETNLGYGASLGEAITATSNELIITLDSDDLLFGDNVFQTCIEVHLDHPEAAMTYSDYVVCRSDMAYKSNMNTRQIRDDETWLYKEGNELKTRLKISHLKTIKRSFYDKTSGIDPTLKKTVDKDLILKLSEVGALIHIDEILMKYRRHENSLTSAFRYLDKRQQRRIERDRHKMHNNALRRQRLQNNGKLRIFVDGSKRSAVNSMFPIWNRRGAILVDVPQEADVQLSVVRKNVKSDLPTLLRIDGIYYDKSDSVYRNSDIGHSHFVADAIIYQSDCSRRMCERHLPKRKTKDWQIVHNGVDKSQWYAPIEHKEINIISCSKWRRVKRLPEMIEIFKVFRLLYPKAIFHVIGPMARGAEEISCDGVLYHGYLSHAKIKKIYQTGDISLHLCKKDSCPSNVCESIAAGVPMVTTNLCGGAAEMCSLVNGCPVIYEGKQSFEEDYIYQDVYNRITDATKEKCVQAMDIIIKEAVRVELPKQLTIDYTAQKYLTMLEKISRGCS